MGSKTEWVEEYATCGCVMRARLRRELPGYCGTHGNTWRNRFKQARSGRTLPAYRNAPEESDHAS